MSETAQLTFDDLGPSLLDVTFVVVDLETDGGSPEGAGITEIGAVKVRGGEVVGQFQSLLVQDHNVADTEWAVHHLDLCLRLVVLAVSDRQ